MQIGEATVETSMGISQKIKNETALWPSDSTSGNLSNETWNLNPKEHKHPMFTAALLTITKIQKQPKRPSVDEWVKQLWDIYYSTLKMKKSLPFATA